MLASEIQQVFDEHWKPGWGSVNVDEVLYMQELIAKHRPTSFIEIGMASGLSGGLIATILDEHGGKVFHTADHDNTFFGDKSKENGFLIEAIYRGGGVQVEKRPFTTALDLDDGSDRYDMAFVDANHQHPWPLIDTLCLFPHMSGPKIVVHHDLCLFRKQDLVFGIGPKYLFDQFPESHRDRSTANDGNIFHVSLDMPREQLEQIAADGFSLPWSLRGPLPVPYVERIAAMIERHYDSALSDAFAAAVSKFNVTDRLRSGL